MKRVVLQVPDLAVLPPGATDEELARESQFLLALKLFELGRMTCAEAARLCCMLPVDFLLYAEKAGIPASVLQIAELAYDRKKEAPDSPR